MSWIFPCCTGRNKEPHTQVNVNQNQDHTKVNELFWKLQEELTAYLKRHPETDAAKYTEMLNVLLASKKLPPNELQKWVRIVQENFEQRVDESVDTYHIVPLKLSKTNWFSVYFEMRDRK